MWGGCSKEDETWRRREGEPNDLEQPSHFPGNSFPGSSFPGNNFQGNNFLGNSFPGNNADGSNVDTSLFQGLSASQLSDPQEIVVAFKQAEQAELVLVEELRSRNSEGKLRSRNSGGNSRSDVMAVQNCELCR